MLDDQRVYDVPAGEATLPPELIAAHAIAIVKLLVNHQPRTARAPFKPLLFRA
jgi:hypothetical protein